MKLNLTKKVKYLGIILNDKLTWKAHVETQMEKGWKHYGKPNIGWQDLGTDNRDDPVALQANNSF